MTQIQKGMLNWMLTIKPNIWKEHFTLGGRQTGLRQLNHFFKINASPIRIAKHDGKQSYYWYSDNEDVADALGWMYQTGIYVANTNHLSAETWEEIYADLVHHIFRTQDDDYFMSGSERKSAKWSSDR